MDFLLHHLFLTSLEHYPDKIAVADNNKSLTYRELSGKAGAIAHMLKGAGLNKGDRVAFFLEHEVEQAVAILAISAAGGVFVPVNRLLYGEQVSHILNDSGSRFLLTDIRKHKSIAEHIKEIAIIEKIIYMEVSRDEQPLGRSEPVIENDLAALLYTSGSTGRPKGVMFTHKNLLAGSDIVSDYLDLRADDRLLGVLQLSFDYGLNQLITMFAKGGTYRFITYWLPNEIVKVLKEERITGLAGIPPVWASLMRSTLAKTDLPHLRYITNSGGAVPKTVLNFLKQALSEVKIYLMYGLTEAFRSTYLDPDEIENRPGSIGKPIKNTEIYVVSKDGTLCKPGETGELVHRGPTVTLGYWNQTEATDETFRELPESFGITTGNEKVVFSGDLVKYDEEGYLYYVGRDGAMIKSHGVRISPAEIEEMLFQSGMVFEAAAVGIPDDYAGEIIKAFVVPKDSQNTDDQQFINDLIDYSAEHMPQYMVPKQVEIVTNIPKTPHGKIDYPSLKVEAESIE